MSLWNNKHLIVSPYAIIYLAWAFLAVLARIWPSLVLIYVVITFTAILPFLIAFVWFARSELGKKGANLLEKWYWKTVIAVSLFAYSLLAKQWTAATINQIFHVDASYLSITSAAVAILYLPLQSIYNASAIISVWQTVFYVGFFGANIFAVMLFSIAGFRKGLKICAYGIIFWLSIHFFFSTVYTLVENRDIIITRFALWADFNSEHLCSGEWTELADSVLFLSGDMVLAHFPKPISEQSFIPYHCDYARGLPLPSRSTF